MIVNTISVECSSKPFDDLLSGSKSFRTIDANFFWHCTYTMEVIKSSRKVTKELSF